MPDANADIVHCYCGPQRQIGILPGGPIGACYTWWAWKCLPCNGEPLDYYNGICNKTYPDQCQRMCSVYTSGL